MVLGCAVKLTVSANLHGSRSEQDMVYCGAREILREEGVSAELCLPPQPLSATAIGCMESRRIHCSCRGRGGSRGFTAKTWGHKQLVAKEGLATPLKMMVLLITDLGRPGLLWSVRIAAGMGGGSHFPAWSSFLMEKQ